MSLGGGGGGGQQQLQQIAQEIEQIEEQIEELEGEVEDYQQEKRDMDEAVEAIETLETGSTVQVPLGGGAFVRAEIEDIDEVIVEFGAGYAAEQEQDDAADILESKKELIDDRIEDVREDIAELETEAEEMEQQAQQLQQQQMQQMQQMQQQADDE
jgi:prefoldin alpha subunit